MANPLPNSLALTTVNDGAQIIASDHRNNYAAIQSAVNTLRAALAGGVSGQVLQAVDGTDVQWLTAAPAAAVYRKTTAKAVVNTVAETDLLNGEVTVAAGVMSTNRVLRLTAFGDMVQNSGVSQNSPRFKVKLGATTLLDTNVVAGWSSSATRMGWRIQAEIANLGAANSQWTDLVLELAAFFGAAAGATFTTGSGLFNAYGAASGHARAVGGGASAADTTLAQVLALSVTLPAASASLDVTLKGALVEIV